MTRRACIIRVERHLLVPAALVVLLVGVTCGPAKAQDCIEAGISAAGPLQPPAPSAPAGPPAIYSLNSSRHAVEARGYTQAETGRRREGGPDRGGALAGSNHFAAQPR